jgi:hypothetical protein
MRGIERLVNLIALLSDTPPPQTRTEIGVEVLTKKTAAASGDGEACYRIERGRQIPDPGLTAEERTALSVAAALVWDEIADDTNQAAVTLDATGTIAPAGPHLQTLVDAVNDRRKATFMYLSASSEEPRRRTVQPHHLELSRGRWYLHAHDELSGEQRIFRLDRIVGDVSLGGAGGFARTADTGASTAVPTRPWALEGGQRGSVDVAIDPSLAWWAESELGTEPEGTVQLRPPEDEGVDSRPWPVFRVAVDREEPLVDWAVSLFDAAVVVGPDSARTLAIERLRGLGECEGVTG